MSIRRFGINHKNFVVCTQPCQQGDFSAKAGEKFELVLDLGAMWVIKGVDGKEIIVPKSSFAPAMEGEKL